MQYLAHLRGCSWINMDDSLYPSLNPTQITQLKETFFLIKDSTVHIKIHACYKLSSLGKLTWKRELDA